MANFLDTRGTFSLRRIVKSPKRSPRIVELAKEHGYNLPSEPDGHELNQFPAKQKIADPAASGSLIEHRQISRSRQIHSCAIRQGTRREQTPM